MKKILFLMIVVLVSIQNHAQEIPGIYYNNEKVGYSRIIGKM